MTILPQGGTIYTITNTVSNTVYIGQTIRPLSVRWNGHKYRLRKGTHTNPHLQSAWNKYGESAFVFRVLEVYPTIELMNEAERSLIEYFRYIGVPMYNSKQGGDNGLHSEESKLKRRGRKMPEAFVAQMRGKKRSDEARKNIADANIRRSGMVFNICSPEGVVFETNNLNGFCREHGLNAPLLWYVLQGKRTHHKGWTRYLANDAAQQQAIEAAQRQQAPISYSVRSPEGIVYTTTNMRAFCKEHDLSPSTMCHLTQGKRKSHKGWTLYEEE